ncbi:MAG: hypothetical protein ACYCXT_13825 [Acidiferrobacteraceae bacterium]
MARIPVSTWIDLPDHPRRRDTTRQARKSHWQAVRLARGPARESTRWVVAAELDGKLTKVDGHTRAMLWAKGQLPDPGDVLATVYRCKDLRELNELHAAFDTQAAAETVFDKVTGAFSEQGLVLTSKRLRSGTIADALSIATRGVARGEDAEGGTSEDFDVYGAVEFYADELRLLDTVNPQNETFYTGLLAAALLSLACDPSTIEFFRALSEGRGQARGGLDDPVAGVLGIIAKMKNRQARFKREQERLCESTLGAVQIWRQGTEMPGYWSSGRYEPVNILKTVRQARERKLLQRTTSAAAE